jgi:uncharacterized SAM-binding protein YcdF (DUF218 family)
VNPLVDFIKEFLIPGSAWFFIITATICTGLAWGARTRRVGRLLLVALVVVYWTMSFPFVARGLQAVQHVRQAPGSDAPLPAAPVPIVVLGNGIGGYSAAGANFEVPLGQTAMNTLFAVARYRRYPSSEVIASGGTQPGHDTAPEADVIRDGLLRNGVPADRILLERRSINTRDQAVEVSRILTRLGQNQCVLVTSPQQMPRAVALFRKEGITAGPLPAGSQVWAPSGTARWWKWLMPSTEARAVSRDVVYELMAWPYYRLRGWLG